jgi:Lrp/AsnC family transcriptional regulator, leucine-responsive regulatory protein
MDRHMWFGGLSEMLDERDQVLLGLLQRDATQSYAALGEAVGLSPGAVHERVRKLRERGVIRRTTVDVDPVEVGRGVLAFVLVRAAEWMGDEPVGEALAGIPAIEEAHVIAGDASLLLKVRAATPGDLQAVLRQVYKLDGVTGTEAIVALDTFFDRPVDPSHA